MIKSDDHLPNVQLLHKRNTTTNRKQDKKDKSSTKNDLDLNAKTLLPVVALEKLNNGISSSNITESPISPTVATAKASLLTPASPGETPHSPSLERFSAISKPRDSLLTVPINANIQWGTFNYIALCYVMAGFAMMADNYVKLGTPIDFSLMWWLVDKWEVGLFVWISLLAFSYVNYLCTKFFVDHNLPGWTSILLYCLWQFVTFTLTIHCLFQYELSPILSGGTGMQLCVYSLKNHSYWHTNYFLKKGVVKASKNNSPISRRDLIPNTSISHFTYFLFAPTLVYEGHFPRTSRIRITYVIKETFAFIGTFTVFYLCLCYSTPFFKDASTKPFLLLLVQLSLPSMSMWMLGFYGVFHCLLNVFAELTKYADREFYQDWWNATTFDQWWRKWNRPVHKWMLRHCYTDSMHTIKVGKFGAFLSTFLLSALLHEIVMILSFRFVRPILSVTMLLQIGLIKFSQLPILTKTRFGNVVMWITVFIGQPFVQLLYSTQYNQIYHQSHQI
ncbi:hypothetical protein SAMD00019534_058810 [Acytostelium subglobosum LB1]|uniref:hypothetical protein n=1 Tax=Acytostelium subglobosum LB1 TaxID=1410327 RepID=UPI0006450FC9|nr:hypothetical protein SAMD00019534_058810 [Acytostelium subglobosum LB1]GAM22706.1 hypothetical protein SAMD00019534_058810 [Acytostelium subglobosum LB1]|eukprot:XP_012753933.1 hypothetical protein SAMD00019534_058810 [Acytostelium subglobosum LB1]